MADNFERPGSLLGAVETLNQEHVWQLTATSCWDQVGDYDVVVVVAAAIDGLEMKKWKFYLS